MNIQELIAKKQKEMAAKKSRQSTLKPQAGKHKYRILPSWKSESSDGQFWHDYSMHFVKTPDSGDKPAAVYVCADKTYSRPCEVCAVIEKSLATCGDDKLIDMLKKAKSAQRYLLNVLHLTGPEPKKVQVLEVGQGVFNDICNMIGEYGDISDINSGTDLLITREGLGLETKYSVMAAAKSLPVPKEVIAGMINLDDFVAQENPAGQTKAISAVANIIGLTGPVDAPYVPAGRSNLALADMSDAEDAEFAPVASRSGGLSADDLADLDDLDALLS
jgi:hypothetical protein